MIIDGHHRCEAALMLGFKNEPFNGFDYLDDRLKLSFFRNECKTSKKGILEHFSKGLLYPSKTTSHFFFSTLPKINIPMEMLK